MSAQIEHTTASEAILRGILRHVEPEYVQDVIDHITAEGGLLDFVDEIEDDEGELAEWFEESIAANPEDALTELLSDDFPEAFASELAAAAEDAYEDDEKAGSESYEDVLDTLAERAHEDDVRLDPDVFSAYVVANEGDVEAAYSAYRDWFRTGDDPDLTDAFTAAVDGDPELGAAAAQRHRAYAADSREVLRGDRLREAAEVKAEAIKSRGGLPADSLDLGQAVADMHGEILAAKELAERDAPERPERQSMSDALADL